MNINFERFLSDVNLTKEEYFKLNPGLKFLIENYSDSINLESTQRFALKDGTALTLSECLAEATTKFSFLNSILKPNDSIIEAAITKFPLAVRYLPHPIDNKYISLAVSTNPESLKYIKQQTDELVDIALSIDPMAIRYVHTEFLTIDRVAYACGRANDVHWLINMFSKNDRFTVKLVADKTIQGRLLEEASNGKHIIRNVRLNPRVLSLSENLDSSKDFVRNYKEILDL